MLNSFFFILKSREREGDAIVICFLKAFQTSTPARREIIVNFTYCRINTKVVTV